MTRHLGIDVGGTHTDAVLLEHGSVVASCKAATSRDVYQGIVDAVSNVLDNADGGAAIDAVMIGTTHFTNAVVERRELSRVAAIRIGLPTTASLGPFVDWPEELREIVRERAFAVAGGHEVDGREIVALDRHGLREAARQIDSENIPAVAVTSMFSPVNDSHERQAIEILSAHAPRASVSLSSELGRIGLLGRENATLLNAAVVPLAVRTTEAFIGALATLGLSAPIYLTQNDGTVARAEMASRYPVFCFASGPTNSMRGAAFLSGLADALVVDVGGTTSDIGVLKSGFPREANSVVEIGGVRTLFRMPDLLSVGLGGGSLVSLSPPAVGPASLGYRLVEEGVVFGGQRLTATDIGVALGWVELGDPERVSDLDRVGVARTQELIGELLTSSIDRMKSAAAAEPLVAVGGGAFLIPDSVEGVSQVVRVDHADVANAVGAALAQVSGEVDRVFTSVGRETAIAEAVAMAKQRAVAAGADRSTLTVVETEDLPLAYLPGDCRRVRAKVVGGLGEQNAKRMTPKASSDL